MDLVAQFPVLVTDKLKAQKEFYESAFGFSTEFFDEDFYLHLAHKQSGIQMAFMAPNHPSQPSFLHPLAGTKGMVTSFEVGNAKSAHDEAVKAGLPLVFDYKVEEFGVSHFMIKDPAGFIIDIVEHHQQ
ncbi:MAG: glyoxalase [Gammaproteobacteria bacterium]|nr:glyoxalase [Gammaproteobacteria bacterium]